MGETVLTVLVFEDVFCRKISTLSFPNFFPTFPSQDLHALKSFFDYSWIHVKDIAVSMTSKLAVPSQCMRFGGASHFLNTSISNAIDSMVR